MPKLRSALYAAQKVQHGKRKWYARGQALVRGADGSLGTRRPQHLLRGPTATAREQEIADWNAYYDRKALNPKITFDEAFATYLEVKYARVPGKKPPQRATALIEHLGDIDIASFTDQLMLDTATKMFKPTASAATLNRDLYTPVIATLSLALGNKAPELTRPEGHNQNQKRALPPVDWFDQVIPHMRPNLRALAAFVTTHGRRLGDALGRSPADFDPHKGTLFINRTKNGEAMLIDLHPGVVDAICAMSDWQSREWLFGYGKRNGRRNVYRDLKAACAKGGTDYFTPHVFGRHVFATRLLEAGYSLQFVKDAGGWKSIKMVSDHYGHLAKDNVTAAVHSVAGPVLGKFGINRGLGGVTEPMRLIETTPKTP